MMTKYFFILSILFVTIVAFADENLIWLETEQFTDYGGWSSDSQFIDQMGSTYLLATGIGKPVADAKTSFNVQKSGEYRIWLRTKDWFPSHHPGQFRVRLDGKELSCVFGASGKNGWNWEDGGIVSLTKGKHKISLHDLTGYYGRCDTIVFSFKPEWQPSPIVSEINQLRIENGGICREWENEQKFDVVVVGGGLAGCTAAVAAVRNGISVALIQDRPVLGGNAGTEILVPPVGLWNSGILPLDANETGLIEEYRTAGRQRTEEGKLYSNRLLRWIENEPNLKLFLNTRAIGVQQDKNSLQILAVETIETRNGKRLRIPGTLFIDCTGDGNLGALAQAEFRHGKESFAMHNEPWAPKEETRLTMGNGIKFATGITDSPKPFKGEDWIFQFPDCNSFPHGRHPKFTTNNIEWQWIIELGGMRNTIQDAEEIRDDLIRLNLGIWDHLKNHCKEHREKTTCAEMLWLGHVAGKRESRRLIGDYILTQNDIGRQEMFLDRVAFGGWVCDDHYSEGFFYNGKPGTHYDHPEAAFPRQYFSIPFRSLYSRNVPNLLMAGRNHSATHLGMSNTRVMLTGAVMGHAAGTGAAISIHRHVTPRGLYEKHITELQQQLLKEGAYLIDLPGNDPNDLARKALLSASSEEPTFSVQKIVDGFSRLNGNDPSSWKPFQNSNQINETPHWLELSWSKQVQFNVIHIAFQTQPSAPKEFSIQIFSDGQWKDIFQIGDNRHRRLVLAVGEQTATKLRFVENQAAAVCEIRIYNEPKPVTEQICRAFENMRKPDVGPFFSWNSDDENYSTFFPLPREAELGLFFFAAEAETNGDWIESTWNNIYFGNGYLHDGNESKGLKSLTFRVGRKMSEAIPKRYEVRFAYSATGNRASNVPVFIRHADGEETVFVDQRKKPENSERFFSIGSWNFDQNSFVRIDNNGTNGYVTVDALLFITSKP
jgi:hypothetical protein